MLALAFILILIGIILLYLKFIFRYYNNNFPEELKQKKFNYAILIPARDESSVIEDLLISIEKQTMRINNENIYVIVENIDDLTVLIAKRHHVNVFYRKDLTLKRKGYALKEVIEDITNDKEYDAYFIFDADNILDKNYFKEMTYTIKEGYDIGIGYRNIKNKTNAIATSSALIFTIINVLSNRKRSFYSLNCNVSGTGFYISGRIINKLKTYPFHSLTEDYELSLYATVNNLTTCYNEKAMFYDEQPVTIKSYYKQRTRWIKGYFEARKLYINDLLRGFNFKNKNFASIYNEIIGVYDLLLIIIGIFLIIFNLIVTNNHIFYNISMLLLIIYIILCFFTIYLIVIEKRFKLNFSLIIKTIFIHPILLFTYIPCAIKALFTRNLAWDKIEHGNK